MTSKLERALSDVRGFVASMDVARLAVHEAARLVQVFAEFERLAAAGRTVAGRRVERSHLWSEQGYRTPALWMASHAQTTVSAAVTTLETGRKLEQLPATAEAFQAGSLSCLQAADITSAAVVDPSAEETLLWAARTESVAGLKERCREVVAAATRDDDVDERIHLSRYLRHWTDPDGAVRVDARLAPDAGARFIAVNRARARKLRDQARRAGSTERREAYAADALVSLSEEGSPGPRAVVHVHVDEAAWDRGHTVRGETCRIPGIGPVPVPAARRLAEGGTVKAVLREQEDVRAVAHFRRDIPAKVRTALEARDVTCVVPGCDEREGLEIDHIVPLHEGGPTRLSNLCRLCHWHHSLKTHRGWRIGGTPGAWTWEKAQRRTARPPPDG